MFRLWAIVRKDNKIIKDMVAEYNEADLSEEDRLHHCIQIVCYQLDLQRPIWLPKNQREYQEYKRAILNQDNFIEAIDFDALELEVIQED